MPLARHTSAALSFRSGLILALIVMVAAAGNTESVAEPFDSGGKYRCHASFVVRLHVVQAVEELEGREFKGALARPRPKKTGGPHRARKPARRPSPLPADPAPRSRLALPGRARLRPPVP